MVLISALFGATAGVVGASISSSIINLPTGPTIVVVLSIFVVISLFFSPNRGLVWAGVRQYLNRKLIRKEMILTNMLLFSESEVEPTYAHDISALEAVGRGSVVSLLKLLKKEGLLYNPTGNKWGLTQKGVNRAQHINKKLKEKV